ncbi:hypothetical protein [Synergistes jonesii]|uniref:Uncharacterized protein n=1 Tax=Synergistes jonesii TaxID=2754 RepID=A0A073IV65_9BACT|nr:hypothetical protein [Synergistes jonesii]KEJ93455.1 hypothetical protein EH55_01365 [Synergistes jonesii]OFB61473.1 hypothetical protein JS72_11085 [Synergistes jonesii]OFB65248.1 hypothetical protein JS73_00020 [Synergistes jonesii]OFB68773.1 hypothetical protein JS79_00020 [Synergistes jonesii]OFB69264.1 hypothetical protein JS78_00020 [Synergistes jonesii]
MSVESATNKIVCVGNGLSRTWSFPFDLPSAADMQVFLTAPDGTPERLTGGYRVSGKTLIYPADASADALPAGYTLTLRRWVAFTQGTKLPNDGEFLAETLEGAYDNLEYQIQQLAEVAGRAITAPVDDSLSAEELAAQVVENHERYEEIAQKHGEALSARDAAQRSASSAVSSADAALWAKTSAEMSAAAAETALTRLEGGIAAAGGFAQALSSYAQTAAARADEIAANLRDYRMLFDPIAVKDGRDVLSLSSMAFITDGGGCYTDMTGFGRILDGVLQLTDYVMIQLYDGRSSIADVSLIQDGEDAALSVETVSDGAYLESVFVNLTSFLDGGGSEMEADTVYDGCLSSFVGIDAQGGLNDGAAALPYGWYMLKTDILNALRSSITDISNVDEDGCITVTVGYEA